MILTCLDMDQKCLKMTIRVKDVVDLKDNCLSEYRSSRESYLLILDNQRFCKLM